jgi:DnaD/phage-associated family protein
MNINRYINFSRLLTLNYKKIGLSDDEYLLLTITYELVQTGTKFVNPSDLSLLCNFTPTKIDVVYSGLIAKKLISNEFSKSNTVYTSFDGIVKKLLSCLEDEVDVQEAKDRKNKIVEEDLFEYMQKFFTRPLSPLEYDVIQGWKSKKYDFALIKASCEIAAQTGNKSIRYIDTIIFEENKKFLLELDEKAKQNKIDVTTCKYVGKIFNTYLVYERNDEIYFIDQHAAHERLIYDKLRVQMDERKVAQQPMLLPYELNLNAFEATFIKERMQDILSMGFDIQEDGETSFKVYAIPVDLQKIDLAAFFNDILGDISGYRAIKLADLLKDKLATAACKAAVKGGMDLTQSEIDKLFSMMDGDMGLKCPHGRPVVVKMTKTQIEKMFKRIV